MKKTVGRSQLNVEIELYSKIRMSKGGFQFSDCQITQNRGCLVPVSENKKI